ncbi:hypothetical protein [Nostoc sp. DedQUE07]|nr:hypothetical protein [Nostoc sp. DedQUE07]MDZ8131894.1 hypothetical protein [Nostoc sp. DedQUE07]
MRIVANLGLVIGLLVGNVNTALAHLTGEKDADKLWNQLNVLE